MRFKIYNLIWMLTVFLGWHAEGQVQACCDNMPSRFGSVSPEAPEGMIWIPGATFTMGVR